MLGGTGSGSTGALIGFLGSKGVKEESPQALSVFRLARLTTYLYPPLDLARLLVTISGVLFFQSSSADDIPLSFWTMPRLADSQKGTGTPIDQDYEARPSTSLLVCWSVFNLPPGTNTYWKGLAI